MDGKVRENKTGFLNIIYGYLLLLTPIFDQYEMPFLSFFEIFCIISVIIYILERKTIARFRINWFVYFGYAVLVTLCIALGLQDTGMADLAMRIIKLFLLLFNMFVIAPTILDLERCLKMYERIVVICAVVLILQNLLYAVAKIPTMFLIPGVTLNYNGGINSSEFMNYTIGRIYTGYYYRPCSFFIEPSFQVQYSLPLLAIMLTQLSGLHVKGKLLFRTLVVTAGMALTTSFLGIACVIILWAVQLIQMAKSHESKIVNRLVWIIPIIGAGTIYLANRSLISYSITSKVTQLSNLSTTSSFTLRVVRGLECFKQTNLLIKIFGCGYGNITSYYHAIGLRTIYDTVITDISYMSGFFTLLCSVGIIGTIIYIITLLPIMRCRVPAVRMLLLCFALLMISSACFDTPNYCVMMALMVTMLNPNRSGGEYDNSLYS